MTIEKDINRLFDLRSQQKEDNEKNDQEGVERINKETGILLDSNTTLGRERIEKIQELAIEEDLSHKEDENNKYHSLDYIKEVLASKNKKEIENIQKIQGWTDEETELYSFMAGLRKEAIDQADSETEERKINGLPPSKEEISMGVFIERLEPQVRDIVLSLHRKGYGTNESGFYNFGEQKIGFSEDVLKTYLPSDELLNNLSSEGVELLIEPDSLTLVFSKKKNLEDIKELWSKVEKDLPDLEKEAEPSLFGMARDFREKYLEFVGDKKGFNKFNKKERERFHAMEIIESFNLSFDDLGGKDVLDLGAGNADLAKTVKSRGINIVSIDREEPEDNEEGVEFFKEDIEKTSFPDEKFDLILSHAAPPTISSNLEEVNSVINEAKRLLKKDGEFRFGPLGLNPEIFADGELFSEEEERDFSIEERVERIKEKSMEVLKKIDITIDEDRSNERGFYILRKR